MFLSRRSLAPAACLAAVLTACAAPLRWRRSMENGDQAVRQGLYEDALRDYGRAAKEAELFPPGDPRRAESLNGLAVVYRAQGRGAEAEKLARRAAEASEAAWGPADRRTAASLKNLADLLSLQGKNREAEPLYRRALDVERRAPGTTNAAVAERLRDVALVCQAQGKNGEAERLYKESLAAAEKEDGGGPELAFQLDELALLYQEQGRFEDAEPLYRRALALREKMRGPGHPETLTAVAALAMFEEARGRNAEAAALYKRAVEGAGKDADRSSLVSWLESYAGLLERMGRSGEAAPLKGRALALRTRR